jgi:hypothetical protein
MRRAYSLRGWIALSVLALPTPACVTWETQPVSPDQVVDQKPSQVRITHAGGGRTIMAGPTIVGDSLIGAAADSQTGHSTRRLSTALSDIQSVEVQRVNGGKTALAIVGVGLATLMFIGVATYDGPFEDSQ